MVRENEAGFVDLDAISWPELRRIAKISVRGVPVDWQTADGNLFYFSGNSLGLARLDLRRRDAHPIGSVRNQSISHSSIAEGGIAFVTFDVKSNAWIRPKSTVPTKLTHDGTTRSVARCGKDEFLVSSGMDAAPWKIARITADGRPPRVLTSGWLSSPTCSRIGKDWWYSRLFGDDRGLYRCSDLGCTRIVQDHVLGSSLSPDEKRISFLVGTNRGLRVGWAPSAGGAVHEVTDAETACFPGWASSRTLWVSRRRRGVLLWTEVDADTGRETGSVVPGGKTCFDDFPDPESPTGQDVGIVVEQTSQVRFQALDDSRSDSRPR